MKCAMKHQPWRWFKEFEYYEYNSNFEYIIIIHEWIHSLQGHHDNIYTANNTNTIIGNDNFNCSLTGDIFYKFQQFSQQQQQQVFKKRVAQQMFEKDNLLNRNYRFLFFSHGRI